MYKIDTKTMRKIRKIMPKYIRHFRKNAKINIVIAREKPLAGYGNEIQVTICGNYLVYANLPAWKMDDLSAEDMKNIAEYILGYFLYGESGEFDIHF